jgi:hypothetical protein
MSIQPLPPPPSSRRDPLADPQLVAESARAVQDILATRLLRMEERFRYVEAQNAAALRIHQRVPAPMPGEDDWCHHDGLDWPCATVRALTGETP